MAEVNFETFRRQFYIGDSPKLINENWRTTNINERLILSFHYSLPVKKITAADGTRWLLLGDAYQSLEDRNAPEIQISKFTTSTNVHEIYSSWSGRWILISENELITDAVALMNCFYKHNENNIEISSTPALLTDLDRPNTYKIRKSGGIEWYPLPDSGFKEINKLLPSQKIILKTGEIVHRPLSCSFPNLDYHQTLHLLTNMLVTSIKTAQQITGKQIKLALTAGSDSRLLMAVLNHNKLPFETYTFHFPLINPADIKIPKKLSKLFGIKHHLIKRGDQNIGKWRQYNIHSGYHAVERDQEMMMYGQYDRFEGAPDIILRGGGFEIASSKVRRRLPEIICDGITISKILHGNEAQADSLQKWIDWVKQHDEMHIDWRDRFYWEQRVAGWLGCTEQALDLINVERLVPSNSLLFYNLMLNIPEELRLHKTHQKDIIKNLSPLLAKVPTNPPVNPIYRQYRKVLFKLEQYRMKKLNLN